MSYSLTAAAGTQYIVLVQHLTYFFYFYCVTKLFHHCFARISALLSSQPFLHYTEYRKVGGQLTLALDTASIDTYSYLSIIFKKTENQNDTGGVSIIQYT